MGPITFNWFTQNARGTKLSVACQGTLYEPNRVKQREELRHLEQPFPQFLQAF